MYLGKLVLFRKVVVFGQNMYLGKIGCNRSNWLYLGKIVCTRANWSYFGKIGCIERIWMYFGKIGFIRAKLIVNDKICLPWQFYCIWELD